MTTDFFEIAINLTWLRFLMGVRKKDTIRKKNNMKYNKVSKWRNCLFAHSCLIVQPADVYIRNSNKF